MTLVAGCAAPTTTPPVSTQPAGLSSYATPTTTTTPTLSPTQTTPVATATPKPDNPILLLASTTSTRDTGLMDVLKPLFQQQTGYVLKDTYVGTGAAILAGLQGNADVLLVHSPPTEASFMQSGYGINRKLVMHNDFVIVGPASDPAGIKGMTSAVDALKKIISAKATFYSRGDASGTDTMDKTLFGLAGITVKDGAATNPSWYIEGGAGTGMLTLLQIADQKNAYTISDIATYLFNQQKLGLGIVVRGDPLLLNIYHVIIVNQAMVPSIKINTAGAQAFEDFMLSPATQAIIADYGVAQTGQHLFFADAGKTEASLGSY